MLIFFCVNVEGSEKERIIENLKKINSIKFNFTQITNDITENGNCLIVYPKKNEVPIRRRRQRNYCK
jgi:hypothetical protein